MIARAIHSVAVNGKGVYKIKNVYLCRDAMHRASTWQICKMNNNSMMDGKDVRQAGIFIQTMKFKYILVQTHDSGISAQKQ